MASTATANVRAENLLDGLLDAQGEVSEGFIRKFAEALREAKSSDSTPKKKSHTTAPKTKRGVKRAKVVGLDVAYDDSDRTESTEQSRKAKSKSKSKYTYGTAPSIKNSQNMAVPEATVARRKKALNDAFGADFCGHKKVLIYHVGMDVLKNKTSDLSMMENNPWTYIGIPKGFEFNGKDAEEVKATLAACGYAWCNGAKVWACRSNGSPARKKFRSTGVARQFKPNADEDE